MKRRQFLAAGASTAALLAAGCQGGGSGSTDTPEPTPTATDTETATATATPSPTATSTSTATATATATGTPDYRSESTETLTISSEDNYAAMRVGFEENFILEWAVENQLSSDLDFDVFLVTEAEFSIYQEIVQGDDREFEYIGQGTVQGVRESASRTVTLDGGQNYILVIDNTDIGDAGDVGTESTRQVQVAVRTRRA